MATSRSRILLWSALSGVLWTAAWPAIGGVVPLAFVAWLPLLHAERLHDQRTAGRRRAFVPYVLPALFIWNIACSWWFFMVSEPMATKLVSVAGPVVGNTLVMSIPWWLKRTVRRSIGPRAATLGFVLFWLSFERLHHDWDLQWPWFCLGNVFGGLPSWVQWYDATGMLGGSLWVLLVNLFAFRAVTACRDRCGGGTVLRGTLVTVAAIAVPLAVSQWRYHHHAEEGPPVEVVVVQPNVDPYLEKFGGVDALEQLDRMLAQAEGAMTDSTVLVVLPETALQEPTRVERHDDSLAMRGLWENDLARSRSVQRIREWQARRPGVAVLSGMSSARLFRAGEELPFTARSLGDGRHWYEAYNAALYMPPDGRVEHYRKSKLVAGVELMPFESVLGPLGDLALDLGGTTGSLGQQEERTVFTDPASGVRAIPAICYESVFGEHIAAHVRNGGNLITVMTNDGWWGESPGYKQHLTFSSLRAIETRRAVARSANTGISCFVDQRGAMRERTSWWTPDARRSVVHLNERLTFFVRHGDLIGRTAMVLGLLLLLVSILRGVRRKTAR